MVTLDKVETVDTSVTENYISDLNSTVGLNQQVEEPNRSTSKYVYSLGSFKFILEKGFKAETLVNSSTTQIPFLPIWHKGLISIHGLIIPIVDLNAFINDDIQADDKTEDNSYLLKLEHRDYSPIAFSLDKLPQLLDTKDYKKINRKDDSPEWISHFLENNVSRIAVLDHRNLFQALINNQ